MTEQGCIPDEPELTRVEKIEITVVAGMLGAIAGIVAERSYNHFAGRRESDVLPTDEASDNS